MSNRTGEPGYLNLPNPTIPTFESETHLALVGNVAEVVAEQGGFGVSNVKVAAADR